MSKVGVLRSRRIAQNYCGAGWSRAFDDKGLRLSCRTATGRGSRSWPRFDHILAVCWSSNSGLDTGGGDMVSSFLSSPPTSSRIVQTGSMPSSLPSVFAVPRWNPLSNYPSSLVYPARPANSSVKCSLNVSTLPVSPFSNDPWPKYTPPTP